MSRPRHPADRADFEAISRATGFCATLFAGRERGYLKAVAGDLAAARAAGRDLEAANRACGRRAMIYAITPEGTSIHVPDDYPAD